ncbi:hypothetical protein LCGC14_2798670 [marine sediment metagenome]|uniref:Uncharacterized protein n=1 Tax=marine sediment metagenome TaxID=412755 RepID=A0A0F8YND2_9ZZZZ
MEFNGSEKQNKWAGQIYEAANLTNEQIDNLLRYAGPAMHTQMIMDVTIIIENRHNLANYANGLGRFYPLNSEKKQAVAADAADILRQRINR